MLPHLSCILAGHMSPTSKACRALSPDFISGINLNLSMFQSTLLFLEYLILGLRLCQVSKKEKISVWRNGNRDEIR